MAKKNKSDTGNNDAPGKDVNNNSSRVQFKLNISDEQATKALKDISEGFSKSMAQIFTADRINKIVKDLASELEKNQPLTFLNRVPVSEEPRGISPLRGLMAGMNKSVDKYDKDDSDNIDALKKAVEQAAMRKAKEDEEEMKRLSLAFAKLGDAGAKATVAMKDLSNSLRRLTLDKNGNPVIKTKGELNELPESIKKKIRKPSKPKFNFADWLGDD